MGILHGDYNMEITRDSMGIIWGVYGECMGTLWGSDGEYMGIMWG